MSDLMRRAIESAEARAQTAELWLRCSHGRGKTICRKKRSVEVARFTLDTLRKVSEQEA